MGEMQTVDEIRHANLLLLLEEHGGVAAFSRIIGRSSAQVSQLKNRSVHSKSGLPRMMGDEVAREIEASLGLERGWMDNLQVTANPLEIQLLTLYRGLSDGGKHRLLVEANKALNLERPRTPSPANPFPFVPAPRSKHG